MPQVVVPETWQEVKAKQKESAERPSLTVLCSRQREAWARHARGLTCHPAKGGLHSQCPGAGWDSGSEVREEALLSS